MASNELALSIALRLESKALKAGIVEAEKDFNRLFAALDADARKAGAAGGLNIRLNKAILDDIAAVRASYAALANTAGVSGSELQRAAEAARGKIADLNAELRGASGGGVNTFSAAMAHAGHSMSLMVAGALSVRQAISGLQATLGAGEAFLNLGTSLKFATGSTAGAARELDFLRAASEKLGLPLLEAGTAYTKLAAATKGTAIEGKATRDVFLGVASAARVMGLSNEELQGALLAVSQMASKGTVAAEELRGQLGERIPGAFKLAAQAMGVTEVEFNKLLDTGSILASDFLPKFGTAMLAAFGGEAANAPRTFSAEMNRLKNEVSGFLDELSRAGVMQTFVDLAREGTQELKRLAASGELKESARNMAAAITAAAQAIAAAAKFAADHWRDLVAVIVGVTAGKTLFSAAESLGAIALGLNAVGGAAALASLALGALPWVALAGGVIYAVKAYSDMREAEAALAKARQRSFESTGALIGQASQYRDTLVLTAAEVAKLSTVEVQSYRDRLKGALAYYNALYETEAKRGDKGDKTAEAAAKAQVDLYLKAISDLKPILAAREKLETDHTAKLKGAQEELIPQLKAALDEQTKLYQDAGNKVADIQKKKTDALKNQAAFESELLAGPKKKPEQITFSDIGAGMADARQTAISGDPDAALKKVEALRENIKAMKEAGTESTLVLSGLAKEIAGIENTALSKAGDKAAKDEEAAKNKLIELQGIAKGLEAIKIGIDQDAAEAALKATQVKMQAFANANPIMQRVIVQAQDKMLLDSNAPTMSAPKHADGGLLSGPGSDTSDNLLAWLSPGEFVMRAAAVRQWGAGNLAAMNALRMPKFAGGGMAARAVSSLPRFAAGGAVGAGASGAGLQPINLVLPGVGAYPMQATPDVANSLGQAIRMAALKRGGR